MLAKMPAFAERESLDMRVFYFKEALVAFVSALAGGHRAGRSSEWCSDMNRKLSEVTADLRQHLVDHTDVVKLRAAKLGAVAATLATIEDGPVRMAGVPAYVLLKVEEVRQTLQIADTALHDEDWQSSLSALEDTSRPFAQLASLLPKNADAKHEAERAGLDELLQTRDELHRRAISLKHRALATGLQKSLLEDDESLDMGKVWDVVDHLRVAIRVARGDDSEPASSSASEAATGCTAEAEAIATAQLGILYAKVLKDDQRGGHARVLLTQAVQLADVVTHCDGRTFFRVAWYAAAKDALEEIRRKHEAMDEEAVRKEREPTLEKLRPELDAIEAAEATRESLMGKAHALLAHVARVHPPKRHPEKLTSELAALGEWPDKTAVLRALRTAAVLYHSDKVENRQNGMEWRVLTEEIMRKVNGHSSSCKEM